jgi:hypothetical protein
MRRAILGSLTTVVALAVSGCGDDSSDPVADPPTSTSSSSSASSPGASSPAATSSPDDATAGVAPATGVLVTSETATVNAPADFKTSPLMGPSGGNVNGPDARYNVALSDNEIRLESDDVGFVAELSQQASVYRPVLARQPDTTVAGHPAYHLAGADSMFIRWSEEYGFRYQGHTIKVTVSTPLDLPQAERDAIAAPVLASVELLG